MTCEIIMEWLKVLISAGTPVSAFLAYLAYRANGVRDADKELTAQARMSLKWAYDALTEEGKTIPPPADRLNWLTCARHLLRHDYLVAQIKTDTYRTVHAEQAEFWRHQFYLALNHQTLAFPHYYAGPGRYGPLSGNGIEPRSAAVVVAFSSWPEGQVDLIERVDAAGMVGGSDTSAKFGVRAYLADFARAREELAAKARASDRAPEDA
ncbi:hypothetical protein [Pseudorhodoferax soli]|uniref:hypothetical protein n=1 Tax=Pseudorhodoferax soli TaxID=545864 RepID=UPI0011C07EF3|nr:hypothetical protein [Pseudorhodoferax soli]